MANRFVAYKAAHPELDALPERKRFRHGVAFQKPDGKTEWHICSGSWFYESTPGTWQAIDTALQDDGTYWHAPGCPAKIAKANRKVSIVDGVYSQTTSRVGRYRPSTGVFTALWTIPAGSVSDDSVVSSGPGYEHRITILPDGLTETLTLTRDPGSMGGKAGDYVVIETAIEGITFPDGLVDDFSSDGRKFPRPTTRDANGVEPGTLRWAKTTGGVQYLYTGIPIAFLSGAAYPVVIDPDYSYTTMTTVYGINATYSTARSTTTSFASNNGSFGQVLTGGDYFIYRDFLKFDTASLSGKTIGSVALKLALDYDFSDTDFDVQIVKQNWSSQDPIGSGNMEAAYDGCLAGTADNNIWRNTSGASLSTYYTSGSLDTSYVNVSGGATYYSLRSSRDYGNTAPSGNEYAILSTTYTAVLVVVTIPQSGEHAYPGTGASSAATSPYDDVDWANPSYITADDTNYSAIDAPVPGSSGPRSPTTNTTTNAVSPYLNDNWVSPGNVYSDDTSYASVTSSTYDANDYTYQLKARGYGFSIPVGATILGVEAKVIRYCAAGSAVDGLISLTDASAALFGNNKASASAWPGSMTETTYGGATDMWGLTTAQLTPSVVNNANFGLSISAKATGANTDVYLDYMSLKVFYQTGASFDSGLYSYLLKATNFGFAIPSGSTINGIEVKIHRYSSAGTVKDATLKLIDAAGALTGNDKADTSTAWPGSLTTATYGSASDMWGTSLTYSDINDVDFGVSLAVVSSASASTAFVDYITMAVTWTEPGSSAIKTLHGLAKTSVKTIHGLAIASVKTLQGLS